MGLRHFAGINGCGRDAVDDDRVIFAAVDHGVRGDGIVRRRRRRHKIEGIVCGSFGQKLGCKLCTFFTAQLRQLKAVFDQSVRGQRAKAACVGDDADAVAAQAGHLRHAGGK